MQMASRIVLGSDVRGLRVAVQGVGNVGDRLCNLLVNSGARLVVADVDHKRAAAVALRYGAAFLSAEDIMTADVDILAPCAFGAVLNRATIPTLKARLICGAADNQLATEADGEALRAGGIAYVPDFVANAGGIINAAAGYLGESVGDLQRRIDTIPGRVAQVLQRAAREGRPEQCVADQMAKAVIFAGRRIAA
jgi:leucine dehydrogenase